MCSIDAGAGMVAPNKHWRHAGHPYLSGQIVGTQTRTTTLGLVPLALRAAGAWDPGVRPLLSAMRAGQPWSDRERS